MGHSAATGGARRDLFGLCHSQGSDADGFRFFGQNHDFAHNYIHDIVYGTAEIPTRIPTVSRPGAVA